MESIVPLRYDTINKINHLNENSLDKKAKTSTEPTTNSAIRLKGQMKWISSWNMIAFLCHPMYFIYLK